MRILCLLVCMCAVLSAAEEVVVSGGEKFTVREESVLVRSTPSGLDVTLRPFMRNKPVRVGKTPCTVKAPPGRHILVVQNAAKTKTHFFSFTLPCEGDFVVDVDRETGRTEPKPREEPKPEPKPELGEALPPPKSRLFVRSAPSRADVFLGDEKLGTTPCLLTLGIGTHELTLRKDGYSSVTKDFVLKNTDIHKPPVVHLGHKLRSVDVIFLEEGWQIFVDGKPYLEDGKPVMAPATVKVAVGKHEIQLVKGDLEIRSEIGTEAELDLTKKKKEQRKEQISLKLSSSTGNPKELSDRIVKKGNGIFYTKPGWVAVDFGHKRKLTSFSVCPYQAHDDAICTPTKFVLLGSHDGETYTKIREFSDNVKNDLNPTQFMLRKPVYVRYIKFEFCEVMQNNVGLRKRIALSEITFP